LGKEIFFSSPMAPPAILYMWSTLYFLPQAWMSVSCYNIQEATSLIMYQWYHLYHSINIFTPVWEKI
jgi:hypothetical protein